jgi:uncharacterized protein
MDLQPQKIEDISDATCAYATGTLDGSGHKLLVIVFRGTAATSREHIRTFDFMNASILAGLEAFEPDALILDFRDLAYTWGDQMHGTLRQAASWAQAKFGPRLLFNTLFAGDGPESFPTAIISSEKCHEGLWSLVQDEMNDEPSRWIFPSLEAAAETLDARLLEAQASPPRLTVEQLGAFGSATESTAVEAGGIEAFVQQGYVGKDAVHELSHVRRVLRVARQLAKAHPCDAELLRLGGYFHGTIYADEPGVRAYLASKGFPPERIELVVRIAWESQKENEPKTVEGILLHDAHLIEGGKTFLITKSLVSGTARGQSLEETIAYIEANVLGKYAHRHDAEAPRRRHLRGPQLQPGAVCGGGLGDLPPSDAGPAALGLDRAVVAEVWRSARLLPRVRVRPARRLVCDVPGVRGGLLRSGGRGVKRCLLGVVSCCSLALCVAVLWLWARSSTRGDRVMLSELVGDHAYCLTARSYDGACVLSWYRGAEQPYWKGQNPWGGRFVLTHDANYDVSYATVPLPILRWWRWGFGLVVLNQGGSGTVSGRPVFWPAREYIIILPHWLVATLLAAPVVWAGARWRRRIDHQACPACGYDLRGTPGSTCPECGADRPTRELSVGPTRQ